jgi:hypothetical protein
MPAAAARKNVQAARGGHVGREDGMQRITLRHKSLRASWLWFRLGSFVSLGIRQKCVGNMVQATFCNSQKRFPVGGCGNCMLSVGESPCTHGWGGGLASDAFDGDNHDHAAELAESFRDTESHSSAGGEIIRRIELWYFKNQQGGWERVPQQNQVLYRERFKTEAEYSRFTRKFRCMPALGGIRFEKNVSTRTVKVESR